MSFRKSFLQRGVKLLVKNRSTWLNSIIKEAVFEQGFIPEIVSNRQYFPDWEQKGYHISQNHFYHPIPDLASLKQEYWSAISKLHGIDLNLPVQIQFLQDVAERFADDFNSLPLFEEETTSPAEYYINNNNFTSIDGEVLYSVIRKYKPKRIIEIGSGYSTFLISKAIEDEKNKDPDYRVDFKVIEPFPRDFVNTAIPSITAFIQTPVQDVSLDVFSSMEKNDIVFIDSTHMLKYGSDVEFEFFEILPILKEGVLVHFHDIFLPKPYPRKWVYEHGWFWNEQYFLQAFLMFNNAFEIIWCGSMMHNYQPALLSKVFRSYNSQTTNPGSIWIRRLP